MVSVFGHTRSQGLKANAVRQTVLSFAVKQFEGERTKRWAPESPERMQLSFVVISRAYFKACVDPDEPSFEEIPPEGGALPGTCG